MRTAAVEPSLVLDVLGIPARGVAGSCCAAGCGCADYAAWLAVSRAKPQEWENRPIAR